METIFKKLESCKDLKDELRYWCRQNGIKVSFTVNMTFSRSKSIFKKLENTYKKGFGKLKTRWLENELKLFHFALLATSVFTKIKIFDFSKEQWEILNEAFPNKLQPILEYEAKNFTINKNTLKLKWEEEEDKLLTVIVSGKTEEPKWNEVATELYIESKREFFRSGKQCRERWLNHLDVDIKHEKWTEEEDVTLIRSVLECGKKWSRIMKCFSNQRTEHMIKNRFLSLILRCKKSHPFIQDEETVIRKLAEEMGLESGDERTFEDQLYCERKLRPKTTTCEKFYDFEESEEELEKEVDFKISVSNVLEIKNEKKERRTSIVVPEILVDHSQSSAIDYLKINSVATVAPLSPNFLGTVPYMNYNSLFPGYGYYQCYLNDFYTQLSPSSSFTTIQ